MSFAERAAFLTSVTPPAAIADTIAVRIWPNADDDDYRPVAKQTKPSMRTHAALLGDVCARLPWIVVLLSAVQCVVFVCFNDAATQRRLYFTVHPLDAHGWRHAWRYLSYGLVHVNFVHLGINVALQLLVGTTLEMEQGHGRVLLVYALSVYGGAACTARFQPQRQLAGASAGVFGLLMSHVPHTAMNFAHLPYRYFRPLAIAVLCVSDAIDVSKLLAVGSQQRIKEYLPSMTISVAAHIGGAVAGTLAGTMLYTAQVSGTCLAATVASMRLLAFGGAVAIVIWLNSDAKS